MRLATIPLLAAACSGPEAPEITHASLALDSGWDVRPWIPVDSPVPELDRPPVPELEMVGRFELPEGDWGGSRLVFEGLWWEATVQVNGQAFEPVTGGIAPAWVEVGPALQPGDNTLTVHIEAPARVPAIILGGGLASSQFDASSATLAVPPRLELRPSAHVSNLALVETSEVQARARVHGAPAGSTVQFLAARDGEVIQDLGIAEITDDLAITTTAWKGERWDLGHPELYHLVAALRDPSGRLLDTAAERTGLRRLSTARPMLNGRAVRLMALRMTVLERGPSMVDRLGSVEQGGANAIEIHGEMVRSDWLDAADELGLPVVIVPRCVGRTRPETSAGMDYSSVLRPQDRRLVEAALDHPSVVLWVTEGNTSTGRFRLAMPSLWTDELLADPHQRPVTAHHFASRVLRAQHPEGNCSEAPCDGAWIAEITAPGVRTVTTWQAMGQAFEAAIAKGAVGGAIPAPDREGTVGWAETWSRAAQRLDVPPWKLARRRAPSRVEVTGLPPDEIAWLSAPGMTTVGAVADATGTATLDVWFAGEATVRAGGRAKPVRLVPRKWDGASITGEAARVEWHRDGDLEP